MPEVEAPIVGSEVDTSDLSGSAKSIVFGILGVGLASIILNYGQQVGETVTDSVESATGINGGGSGDVIQGDF